jgi:predicted nucleic acid-binding protein
MIGADTTLLVQIEVAELPAHGAALELLRNEILSPQIPMALAPQVLAEFIHVVTDPRRFQKPLTMQEALAKAEFWWNAAEVEQVFPTDDSERRFIHWMQQHQLGRKRVLDTQLASTLWEAGVRSLITSNPDDFQKFGFRFLTPKA